MKKAILILLSISIFTLTSCTSDDDNTNSLKQQIVSLQDQVEDLNTQISDLDDKISDLDSRLSDLETKVE